MVMLPPVALSGAVGAPHSRGTFSRTGGTVCGMAGRWEGSGEWGSLNNTTTPRPNKAYIPMYTAVCVMCILCTGNDV